MMNEVIGNTRFDRSSEGPIYLRSQSTSLHFLLPKPCMLAISFCSQTVPAHVWIEAQSGQCQDTTELHYHSSRLMALMRQCASYDRDPRQMHSGFALCAGEKPSK